MSPTELAYQGGVHTPLCEEHTAEALPVRGQLPSGLRGTFARNSGAPRFAPRGRYHWFDGDGMVHAVRLGEGRASYRNRWVRTRGLERELGEGRAIWPGILEPPDPTLPGGPLKDTANTDLVWWNERLLALWWLSGTPYELRLPELETVGPVDFQGTLRGRVAAHAKPCPTSGELVFFDYSVSRPPWYQYGVVGADGRVRVYTPIETAGPRIPHDIAITPTRTVLLDLPLGWDPQQLRRGKFRIAFDRAAPSRFGVLPRHGDGSQVRWFELEACYVYHTVAAWDDGDAVVVVGCAIDDPIPDAPRPGVPHLDTIQLAPRLTRWRFDLASGRATRELLDERLTEFPRARDDRLGLPTRFAYHPRVAPADELLFAGLIKYRLDDGTSVARDWPRGWFGGEVVFAPDPAGSAEDDGWLLTILSSADAPRSELWVLDARDPAREPLARVELPARVPPGFHAAWCPGA